MQGRGMRRSTLLQANAGFLLPAGPARTVTYGRPRGAFPVVSMPLKTWKTSTPSLPDLPGLVTACKHVPLILIRASAALLCHCAADLGKLLITTCVGRATICPSVMLQHARCIH